MKKLIALISLLLVVEVCQSQEDIGYALKKGFQSPPNQAKARTWWHWISGNVSKSGITKDLEAMKAVGIQEAQLFNVHLGFPKGPVKYLSEEWLDLFKFSAKEAQRLGLELAFHNSAGWSSSGGPWVAEEHAMQTLVFSELEVNGDQLFKEQLPKPKTKFDYYKDVAVLAFPKPKKNLKIDGLDYKNLSERIRNHLLPDDKEIPKDAIIQKEDIIDLTSKLKDDGSLDWNIPTGEWIILRLGHTPIGTTNRPAPPEAKGLEIDKMSKKALDAYWEDAVQPIIDKLGDLIGTTVNNCLIDSYEVETTNWTTGFDVQFEALRGYDLTSYLPTIAGYYVDSGEVSERFLWDFRRTIGDLIAENYYAHFAELCHKKGMKFSVEPYWGPFDNMQVGATGDIVMCEFWSGGYPFFDSPKFVSSIAHLNGSAIVGAESFTGIGGWDEHPAQLKAIGDRAWAEGITRFIFHTYVHQPWDVTPGLALSYHGTDFNRLNTWWYQSKSYMAYIARSQFLLQQGTNVADVLVFTGESSPNTAFLFPEIKSLGYDYDLIGANKLSELVVKDGDMCTPVGGKYKVLVLPESDWITPKALKIVESLVKAGATVIGNKPKKSPSLNNYPSCDDEVKIIADKLWNENLIQAISISDYLQHYNSPDFKIEEGVSDDLNFIHRKKDEAEIYFIANGKKQSRVLSCRFRVSGKQPEVWNAETGKITYPAVWENNGNGTTTVTLTLEAEQSIFVVFKEAPIIKNNLVAVEAKLDCPKQEPLSNLKIIKAEYGTFLQEGIVDITNRVVNAIEDGKLDFKITRAFCHCDPAMGYKKEFRMAYQIGDTVHQLYAEEREHITIDVGSEELKILKAVFGKFKPETKGVPKYYPLLDITGVIQQKINSGEYEILVDDAFIDNQSAEGDKPEVRVTYETDGEEYTKIVSKGQILKLSKPMAKPQLVLNSGYQEWVTPYSGTLNYINTLGESNTVKIKSIPDPLELSGAWDVNFESPNGVSKIEKFDKLLSWSESSDESIRYFSGTASYTKKISLPRKFFRGNNEIELDLGSISVIAEVNINGNYVGTLWKAPFRVNISDFVKKGTNSLEIKVTNLWPNRLIGDEQFTLDYKIKGERLGTLPDWLLNNQQRLSNRTTLPSWKHWSKNDLLKTSGLLGPVKIQLYKKIKLESTDE
ncbi:glycosyl hydrolase [Aestuariivivens insulae]|uniref:glycosyl hydrolase n=1 Tax=Aestuariivivens insulae TaxID=1621988 RepID=UPI001F58AEEB|nr:glycosyl hydrolase [Aestuariivivens insulae]